MCGINTDQVLSYICFDLQRLLVMNFKRTLFAIQEKKTGDLDDSENYPTLADLMKEQNTLIDKPVSVHQRRDLDSLG